MAPTRKRRENQYFDVGKEGRKTGITVAEQPKDKYGLESVDNVFSSPRKSVGTNDASNGALFSNEMELSRGSAVDPTIILTERRVLKSTKSHLAPPSSRSPRKTNLGSSPRRHSSIGPSARQSRSSIGPPIRGNGVRKLDFNQDLHPEPAGKISPLRADLRRGARKSTSSNIYDLRESPEAEPSVELYEHTEIEEMGNANISSVVTDALLHTAAEDDVDIDMDVQDDLQQDIVNVDEGVPMPDNDDEYGIEAEEEVEEAEEPISSPMLQKTNRVQPQTRRRKSDRSKATERSKPSDLSAVSIPAKNSKGPRAKRVDSSLTSQTDRNHTRTGQAGQPKNTKPKRVAQSDSAALQSNDDSEVAMEDSSMPPPTSKPASRKGRPRKRKAEEDENEEASETNSKKHVKPTNKKQTRTSTTQDSSSTTTSKLLAPPSRRPGPGQLTFLRQQTPAEELSTITRSGRRCVQPLHHWKLEKAEREWDGTITSVERVAEVEAERPRQKRRVGRKVSQRAMDTIEEKQDDLEDWEAEGGSVIGPVQAYNPEDGTSSYDMHEEEIALGRLSITTKEVHGANFRYGKIVSMDFFGAGLIDLPVDGFKSKKQTRKMHMSFFVAEGKVTVTVGATRFTINKGGTWQVPRGNSYSIVNAGQKPAKLFFAQANEKFIATDEEISAGN